MILKIIIFPLKLITKAILYIIGAVILFIATILLCVNDLMMSVVAIIGCFGRFFCSLSILVLLFGLICEREFVNIFDFVVIVVLDVLMSVVLFIPECTGKLLILVKNSSSAIFNICRKM